MWGVILKHLFFLILTVTSPQFNESHESRGGWDVRGSCARHAWCEAEATLTPVTASFVRGTETRSEQEPERVEREEGEAGVPLSRGPTRAGSQHPGIRSRAEQAPHDRAPGALRLLHPLSPGRHLSC